MHSIVLAQKVRSRALSHLQTLFQNDRINLILTPTTAITSPRLPSSYSALSLGYSNNSLASDAMRFAFLSNFAGLPALSVPVGWDEVGLAVGLQVMGEWWDEGTLMVFGKWVETLGKENPEFGFKRADKWIGDVTKEVK